MLLVVYFIPFFLFCHQTETAQTTLTAPPSDPSFAIETRDLTLVWEYTLDGSVLLAQFFNITGGGNERIARLSQGGSVNVEAKYQDRFTVVITDSQASLTIRGVESSDQGKYRFTLSPTGSGNILDEVDVIVQAVANFTNVSSDTTLLEGQDLQLFCIASGRPDPNITWVRISPSGFVTDVLHRGTTWDFKNISRAEASIYRCIASNGVEDPVSHTIDVSVISFTWNKAPSDPVYGILGENVTLSWSFKTDASQKLHYFTLLKDGMYDMITYNNLTDKLVYYKPYNKGSVALERNATPSFILINLKSGDVAKYCCKVYTLKTMEGSDSQGNTHSMRCTHLKLLARPSITSISNNRTLNKTNDATLSCTASGKPPPNVTWTKADDVGNVLSWSSSLELKNITRKQEGLYRCTADNGLGKAESSVRIIVQYAPSIKFSTTRYNFTEGTDMTLPCESDGVPAPTVTWSKIGGVSNFSYLSGQRLIIRNVTRTEAGTYRCTASNGIGKPALDVMHVNVFYPASIVRGPLNLSVNETTDLHLFCNATGNPQPLITWFRGLIRLERQSPHSLLIVRNISKSDSGIYKCIASNNIGFEAEATSTVTINYKPRTTLLTPKATKVNVIEGHPVTFYCTADGVPPPILELHFNGVLLGYFTNGKYVMEKINATDRGLYECVARNILGISRIRFFHVNVLVPPSLDFVTKNATVNETHSLELFCNATGKPRPNITWTFLGGADEGYSRKGETLTISDVKRNQAGFYQCTASNNVTSTQAVNALVTVNYKPEIVDRSEATTHNVMSWIGRETNITCEVEGVPLPEIIWTRDGKVASSKTLNRRVSTLTFTPQRESDFGAYLCKASNFLGVARKVINVQILAKPEAPTTLEVLAGVNGLVIRWNASITHPAGPVRDYLVQVKEEGDPLRLKNCSRIEQISSSFTCTLDNLKSGTVYIVRVAAFNIVGYSDFTEEEIRTKDVDDDENKEMGALKQHKRKSTYVVDAIIGGVIGLSSLVVIIVAIVINRRPCHKGGKKSNIDKSFKDGHDNEGFAENPKADELQEQQV